MQSAMGEASNRTDHFSGITKRDQVRFVREQNQDMKVRAINRETLDLLLEMGRASHPNEFAALLSENDGAIDEISLIPGTIGGSASASLPFDMVPLHFGIAGSAHSHPNGVIRPSDADIRFFAVSGSCHIIVGYPYGPDDWRCFYPDGNQCDIEVI